MPAKGRNKGATKEAAPILDEQEVGAVEVGRVDLGLNAGEESVQVDQDHQGQVSEVGSDSPEHGGDEVVFVLVGAASCSLLGLGISVKRGEEIRVSDPAAIRRLRASRLFEER